MKEAALATTAPDASLGRRANKGQAAGKGMERTSARQAPSSSSAANVNHSPKG